MKTITHICDICKQCKSEDGLLRLEVGASNANGLQILGINRYSKVNIDICPECLTKKGFVVDAKPEEERESAGKKNAATLESKIFDILEDLGVAFVE